MVANELTKADPDGRKVVVASGERDEGGARGEEGEVERPEVPERGADGESRVETDKEGVGVGAPVKGE